MTLRNSSSSPRTHTHTQKTQASYLPDGKQIIPNVNETFVMELLSRSILFSLLFVVVAVVVVVFVVEAKESNDFFVIVAAMAFS